MKKITKALTSAALIGVLMVGFASTVAAKDPGDPINQVASAIKDPGDPVNTRP